MHGNAHSSFLHNHPKLELMTWVDKVWYIHTMEYYSVVRIKGLLHYLGRYEKISNEYCSMNKVWIWLNPDNSIAVTIWKGENYRNCNGNLISGSQRSGRMRSTGDLTAVKWFNIRLSCGIHDILYLSKPMVICSTMSGP